MNVNILSKKETGRILFITLVFARENGKILKNFARQIEITKRCIPNKEYEISDIENLYGLEKVDNPL